MTHPMKAYQRVRITTASPAELVIMLCEGLVRFTAGAAEALEEGDLPTASRNFSRAAEIVGHLRESLNEEVAPDLVNALDRTYELWSLCLVRAQINRDATRARTLLPQMEDLLSSWRAVANQDPTLAVAS